MHSILSRRKVLSSAAAAAGAFAAGAPARAETNPSPDPDADAVLARMTKLSERGASLPPKSRHLVMLATLSAIGLPEHVESAVKAALRDGLTPAEVKEAFYQTTPYVGFARVSSVLRSANKALSESGVKLPIPSEGTVTDETRFAEGFQVQSGIFGDAIRRMHESAPESQKALLVRDLTGWCFGDYYTRKALDLRERELITFSAIVALGGCEAQVRAHVNGNVAVGAVKQNLVDALEVGLPFLGFPRTLNALAVVNDVLKD